MKTRQEKGLERLSRVFVDDFLGSSDASKVFDSIIVAGESEQIPELIKLMGDYMKEKGLDNRFSVKREGRGYVVDADTYI